MVVRMFGLSTQTASTSQQINSKLNDSSFRVKRAALDAILIFVGFYILSAVVSSIMTPLAMIGIMMIPTLHDFLVYRQHPYKSKNMATAGSNLNHQLATFQLIEAGKTVNLIFTEMTTGKRGDHWPLRGTIIGYFIGRYFPVKS